MFQSLPCPDMGYRGPLLEPRMGADLVAGPLPMGSSRAQPKAVKYDPLPEGSPPAGGAKGVGCKKLWVAAEGRDLGGPILGCRNYL